MPPPNLLKDSISSLLWKIGFPAGIGFFFNTLFNITDAYWAGKLGVEAATAMSQTFPLFLLLIVCGNGLSSAASALLGNAIGENNKEKMSDFLEHIIFLSVLLVILITPVLLFLAPSILSITGALDASVQAFSRSYIFPILFFSCIFIFSYILNGILNAYGDTRTYSRALIVGAIINLGLDPLLMFGWGPIPAFGIAGVAYATIIIQMMTLCYMVYMVYKKEIFYLCKWSGWRPRWNIVKQIFHIAIPSSLSMVFVAIGIFVINAYLRDFGTSVMAVYGVGTRIEQLALLPTIGLSIAASAIIAQNNGAKKFDRVRKTYGLSLLYGSLIILPLVIGIWIFQDKLYPLFISTKDPADAAKILQLGREYTTVVIGLFWGYIFLFITVGALQSIKKPMFGLIINLFRQIILPIIIFTMIIRSGGDYKTIWWSIFGIVWFSAFIGIYFGYRIFSRLGIPENTKNT